MTRTPSPSAFAAIGRELIDVAADYEGRDQNLAALMAYNVARQPRPGDLAPDLGWGRAAQALGDTAEARSAYRTALETFPDNPDLKARLAALEAE